MKKTLTLLSCAAGLVMIFVGCESSNKTDTKGEMKSGSSMSMDKPMMAKGDIIDVATGPGMSRVTTLVQAVQAAGLVETLKGPGPFTVFAPTNEAFAKLPAGTLEDLLKPENREKLKSILLYHVHVGDAIPAANVRTMALSTANGKPLTVVLRDGNVMINNAKVIKTDVPASNGIIHWIDTVVLP